MFRRGGYTQVKCNTQFSGVARRRKVGGGHKFFPQKVKSKKKKVTAAYKRKIGYLWRGEGL